MGALGPVELLILLVLLLGVVLALFAVRAFFRRR